MTRQFAQQLVEDSFPPHEASAFEQYADIAEAWEGADFWNDFVTHDELIDDFRLYVTVGDRNLAAVVPKIKR